MRSARTLPERCHVEPPRSSAHRLAGGLRRAPGRPRPVGGALADLSAALRLVQQRGGPAGVLNHEQVVEQEHVDTEVYPQLHQIFVPLALPALGAHVLFVQQHFVGNPNPTGAGVRAPCGRRAGRVPGHLQADRARRLTVSTSTRVGRPR